MRDISPPGDEERKQEIDKLPEQIKVDLEDGTSVGIPFRAMIQDQDDAWREFRDSPLGKMILGDNPDYGISDGLI